MMAWLRRNRLALGIWRAMVYAAGLFWQFVLLCTDLTNEFLTKNGAQLAAAIAYYSLLSLIPLSLGLASILGFLMNSEEVQARVVTAAHELLPVSQDYVADTLKLIVKTRAVTGVIGLVGLFWPSMAVFGIIRKTVNFMWGGTKPRPFLQERLIDITLTVFGGILVVAPIVLTVLYGFLGDLLNESGIVLVPAEALMTLAFTYVSPVVTFFVFLFLYRYLPNTRVAYREIWPGVLLVTLAFEVNKWWFFWYARSFSITNTIYGPIGALMVLLGWVWVSADILLYGAMATARISPAMSRKIEEWALSLARRIALLRNLLPKGPIGEKALGKERP